MDIIIDTYMAEYWGAIKKLEQIPGVGKKSAEIILAEIGLDMNQFPTAGHLASWAGVAPGNNESAGKRKSGRTETKSFTEAVSPLFSLTPQAQRKKLSKKETPKRVSRSADRDQRRCLWKLRPFEKDRSKLSYRQASLHLSLK